MPGVMALIDPHGIATRLRRTAPMTNDDAGTDPGGAVERIEVQRLVPAPAVEGGTLVTSYYGWSHIDPAWRERNIFPIINQGALRGTLGILTRRLARGSR